MHQKVDLVTFIDPQELQFIQTYREEHFNQMILAEQSTPPMVGLMDNQEHIPRPLRMRVINWLYEIVSKFKIKDRSLCF